MSDANSRAGPSTSSQKLKKSKRKNDSGSNTPIKTPRLASPIDQDDTAPVASSSKSNGVDPMDALDNDVDPMEKLAHEAGETVVPTRADEFEQQAEREVEASKGLDGAVEEGKMKLVHQVRHQVCTYLIILLL